MIIIFLAAGFVVAQEIRWSGTLTLEQRMSGTTGTSERHVRVTFNNALPTLNHVVQTTDLNFTDDKGTGSVTLHGEAIIGGKRIGTTDCSGSGQSELHEVVIDEENNTYSISAIGPECVGTSTGMGSTTPYGPEVTDIIVPDQRLLNPNVLSGSLTTTSDMGIGTVTTTITWDLSKGKSADVELIVIPAEYDRWLPAPGRDELIKGSVMEVSFKLQGRSGSPVQKKAKSFDVRLSNTSKEPGITLNAPLNPSATQLPDLRLVLHPSAESGQADQFLNVPSADGITGKIYIASYDGGGYSILTVEGLLQDNTRVKGQLLVSGGDTNITIPKRLPNSHIGTAWLNANGNPQERDDKEKFPGNPNDGDGFSAYEEYRGFLSEGMFKRLDPQEKELAVRIWSQELPLFADGIHMFEAASGLTVVRFHIYEVRQDRRINFNSATSQVYKQFAIPLVKGSLRAGGFARAFTTSGDGEIPKNTTAIVIAVNNISAIYQSIQQNSVTPVPFTHDDLLAATIAHELGHGVDVPHHGDLPDEPSPQTAVDNTYRIFNMFGNEITNRPYRINGNIGVSGSSESGDLSCVMAYNPYFNWSFRLESNGTKVFHEVPWMVMGRSMCKSRVGTGINAPSLDPREPNKYFGKATNGNCLSLIKLWE